MVEILLMVLGVAVATVVRLLSIVSREKRERQEERHEQQEADIATYRRASTGAAVHISNPVDSLRKRAALRRGGL